MKNIQFLKYLRNTTCFCTFLVLVLFSNIYSASAELNLVAQKAQYDSLPFNSKFLSGKTEMDVYTNETVKSHFVFQNIGIEKWGSVEDKNPVFLGVHDGKDFKDLSNDFRNWGWSNELRIRMTEQFFDKKTQSDIAMFGCEMTAPKTPGDYKYKLQLVVEGDYYSGFFGDEIELTFHVKENDGKNNATENTNYNQDTMPFDELDVFETEEELDKYLESQKMASISGEIQRVIEAKNEISNYEKALEKRLKVLEERSKEIETEMENVITEEGKEQIIKEIDDAKAEKERLSNQLNILQRRIDNDNKLFSANIKDSLNRAITQDGNLRINVSKVVIFSVFVFFIAFFVFEYLFSRQNKTHKSQKK